MIWIVPLGHISSVTVLSSRREARSLAWEIGLKAKMWLILAVTVLGLAGMGTYPPLLRVERVYVVVPLRYPDSPVVSMRRTNEVREVRIEPAGYGWAWSVPHESGWFGTKLEHRINWRRLLIEAGLWVTAMSLLMAAIRPPKSNPQSVETRDHHLKERESADGGA